jgi:hypothetical protein
MKTLILAVLVNYNDTLCRDTIYVDKPAFVVSLQSFWDRHPIDTIKPPVITLNKRKWINSTLTPHY